MSTGPGEDFTRVTVISPTRRIDLALPGRSTVAEVLPDVLRLSGYEGALTGEPVHGWALQRFGDDPLEPGRTVTASAIRDGEVLHLVRREEAMPDAAFDDVVDAVGGATSSQPSWEHWHSRRTAIIVLSAMLLGTPVLLSLGHRGAAAITALVLAGAVGLAAILLSRAFDRRIVAGALAWLTVGLAAVGGWNLLDGGPGIQVLTTAALILVSAGTMALGVGVHPHALAGVGVGALLIVIAAMVDVLVPDRQVQVSAVALGVVLGSTPLLPGLCYRLARVAMPSLPTNAEALSTDDSPVQGDIVVRAIAADRILAALLGATAVTAVLFCYVLLGSDHWAALALSGAAALAMVLRSRSFVGRNQRLPMLAGGLLIGAATVIRIALLLPNPVLVLGLLVGLVAAVSALLVWYATSLVNSYISPFWGRIGDVVEWLAVMAIIPLVLAVLDLYQTMRGLKGA